jgi:hypothetical protein
MLNWQKLVHDRFAQLRFGAEIEPEVTEELGHFLEDPYEAALNNGLAEQEAAVRALAEVRNWARLARKIKLARGGEEMIKQRIQAMWLPGLAATIASLVLPMGVGFVADQVYAAPRAAMFVYDAWLVMMAGIGALAAYWSRRAGGSKFSRVTAALLPAGVLFVVIVIVLVASLITLNHPPASMTLAGMARSMVRAVLLPAAALLAGALPFLRGKSAEAWLRVDAA